MCTTTVTSGKLLKFPMHPFPQLQNGDNKGPQGQMILVPLPLYRIVLWSGFLARNYISWPSLYLGGNMWLVQWNVSRSDVCCFLLMWFGSRGAFCTFFFFCQLDVSVQNILGSNTLEMKEQQCRKSLGSLDLHLEEDHIALMPIRNIHSGLRWIKKLLWCLSHCSF